MIEAARTSETLVNFYQTTRHYNPEDSHLRNVVTYEWNIEYAGIAVKGLWQDVIGLDNPVFHN
jgi:hypothetical protein